MANIYTCHTGDNQEESKGELVRENAGKTNQGEMKQKFSSSLLRKYWKCMQVKVLMTGEATVCIEGYGRLHKPLQEKTFSPSQTNSNRIQQPRCSAMEAVECSFLIQKPVSVPSSCSHSTHKNSPSPQALHHQIISKPFPTCDVRLARTGLRDKHKIYD